MADVYCKKCKGCYHETTDAYDPDRPLRGDMFRAKQCVEDNKWWSFMELPTTPAGEIECPNCGALYDQDGTGLLLDYQPVKKPRKIPDDYNSIIVQMTNEGKTPTEIAEHFNFTCQAVGRRLYDLKMREENQ